jgi:hypothetical protein
MIAHARDSASRRAGSLPSPSCASTSSFAAACRLHQRKRALSDGGERLPLLLGQDLLAQRQQRLLRPLDLAVQRADGRKQVVDSPGSIGLLEAATEFVAHPGKAFLGLGIVGQCLQLRT